MAAVHCVRRLCSFACSGVFAFAAGPALADEFTWDGGGPTYSYEEPLNWSPDIVPGPDDTVIIDSFVAEPIVFGMYHECTSLRILAGSVEFDFDGYYLEMEYGVDPAVQVDAPLTLRNGWMECYGGDVVIADGVGSTGTITVGSVDGQGGGISCDNLFVGRSGSGAFEVIGDGGTYVNSSIVIAELAGSDGRFTHDGSGSADFDCGTLIVGKAGNGTLVSHGTGYRYASSCIVGDASGSSGEMTLEGDNCYIYDWTVGGAAGSSGIVTVGPSTQCSGSWVTVGRDGSGEFTLQGGASVYGSYQLAIGVNTGSDGSVVVSGEGSFWYVNGAIRVAGAGQGALLVEKGADLDCQSLDIAGETGGHGTLLIESGANVECEDVNIAGETGADGAVTITGADSELEAGEVNVGESGTGTLLIEYGGWFSCDELNIGDEASGSFSVLGGAGADSSNAFFGEDPGGIGQATVSGAGSTWYNIGEFFVLGVFGTGSLDISDGGLVFNPRAILGLFPGSTGAVTVDGVGTRWDNLFDLVVGREGSGSVTITNGAFLSNGLAVLGALSGADGTVTVSGEGSSWTCFSDLTVGGHGSGALTITNGASVTNMAAAIGSNDGSSGAVVVDGNGVETIWNNLSTLAIGGSAGATATVTVAGAGTIAAPFIAVNDAGTVDGDGVLQGDVTNFGAIEPGRPLGTLVIDGDYEQVAPGTLRIEIGSAGNDVLSCGEDAFLGGTLELAVIDGFIPTPGEEFIVLTAPVLVGTFDEVSGPAQLEVVYGLESVVVRVVGDACPADISMDGAVGFPDLLEILAAWGPCPGCPQDLDADDDVGFSDLLFILAEWGPCDP